MNTDYSLVFDLIVYHKYTHNVHVSQATMINITASQVRKMSTFVAFLRIYVQERQLLITPICTVYVVYDSTHPPIDPILEALQYDGRISVILMPFKNAPKRIITHENHDESHLYIFVFCSINTFHFLDEINGSLVTPAPIFVLLLETSDRVDRVIANLGRRQHKIFVRLDREVLLHFNRMLQLPVNLTDAYQIKTLQTQIQHTVATDKISNSFTIFIHYRSFYCMMTPIDAANSDIELTGTDVLVARTVARYLKRTKIQLSTDGLIVDPKNELFFYISKYYAELNRDIYLYNPRLFTSKPSYDFDFNM